MYLTKATSSAGNQRTYTVSVWCKLTRYTTASQTIFSSDIEDDGANYGSLSIEADGLLKFINLTSSSLVTNFQSNRLLRDATGWYHIVLRVDTTQASAGDRIRLYVNGEQVTSWAHSTTPNQNTDTGVFKSGTATLVGVRHPSSTPNNFEGYLAHMHIVDGTSYGPDTFAETDSTTGSWKPILSPSVTYGTNGAFLKFEDSSALGTDSNGSNNFTVSGNVRQSVSTPSNNFCTLDVNQAYLVQNVDYAGTAFLGTSTNQRGVFGTLACAKGKWYAEFKIGTDRTSSSPGIGIVKNGTWAAIRWKYEGNNATPGRETGGSQDCGITYEPTTSSVHIIDQNSGTTYGSQAGENDIIMMAWDLDNGKIWFGKNGTWNNAPGTSDVGNPATGANPGLSFTVGGDYWSPAVHGVNNQADNANKYLFCNFGEGRFGVTAISSGNADDNSMGSFEYDVPAGFYALCTKNINSEA